MTLTSKQKEIVDIYANLAKINDKYPARSDMVKKGISRDRVRRHFGNMGKLKETALVAKPEAFKRLKKKDEPHPYSDFTREALGSIVKENDFSDGIFFITAVAPCSHLDLS
jgi:hypothetical protein